ncbi:aldehyde dehydrogenase family protein, partial [Enterococcus faecalis]|uniref:aldehyde dehydrogenase family protein n=1 Tax=Enterococcus faecalis TaxID=1351 RepID=UPI003D6BA8BE
LMGAWKLAPGLAAGNRVVIDPSSCTSLSLLKLFKIFDQVLPKEEVNLITGRGTDSGNYMLAHTGFDKLALKGSTEMGYT